MVQQAQIVPLLHSLGRGRLLPFGHDLGTLQQALGLLEFGRNHDQRRNPLVARPPRAARPVQKRLAVGGQIGVDHQIQPRQVDAPRRHIRRDAHPRPPVAQRLQRVGALGLAQFARQRHRLKTPVAHPREQMVHIGPRLAEHQGRLRFIKPQHVEDRMFPVARRHRQGAVRNVDMLARLALGLDAQGVALEILGQRRDLPGHGGRKHQRAPLGGGGAQNVFQILAEPQVQHLVRLVQNHGPDARHVQRRPLDVVAQTPRRADDNMRPPVQRALFGAVIHAAHTGRDLGVGALVKPVQLARHLQRQFPRRRNHQRHRRVGVQQLLRPAQQFLRNRNAKGHRLARAGLRRDQKVAPRDPFAQHRLLHRSHCLIALGSKGCGQRGRNLNIGHVLSQKGALAP